MGPFWTEGHGLRLTSRRKGLQGGSNSLLHPISLPHPLALWCYRFKGPLWYSRIYNTSNFNVFPWSSTAAFLSVTLVTVTYSKTSAAGRRRQWKAKIVVILKMKSPRHPSVYPNSSWRPAAKVSRKMPVGEHTECFSLQRIEAQGLESWQTYL